MDIFESPNGTYAVRATPWEARNSSWVYTPDIIECSTGAVVLAFSDQCWSLDKATWQGTSIVHLLLRKYPGDHTPPFVEAIVDCANGIGFVGSGVSCTIAGLEQQLEAALAPAGQGPNNSFKPKPLRGSA